MAFHCPECQEARVEYIGLTDDARSHLRCQLCGHEWFHGAQPVRPGRRKTMSYTEARAAFPGPEDVPPAARARANQLKAAFLDARPMPDPEVASFWSRYQRAFSADGLPEADPGTLKFFANTDVGAHPGNMSVFNRGWNELGDAAAAEHLRSVIYYLLRGPADVPVEDRLDELINPEGSQGMTGFRESLLTKVLCVMHPERFLPILIYTSKAGGKREIARAVYGLDLPRPEATSWTRGRLACWSNDLLIGLLGDGFQDLQHASQFLWWAKDQPTRA